MCDVCLHVVVASLCVSIFMGLTYDISVDNVVITKIIMKTEMAKPTQIGFTTLYCKMFLSE